MNFLYFVDIEISITITTVLTDLIHWVLMTHLTHDVGHITRQTGFIKDGGKECILLGW